MTEDVMRKVSIALWLAFSVLVVLNAWVSEDAYITFRVIDNFFRGYGLRWNVTERVQVFTHPLWLLLHIPLRVFIPNVFVVSCVLSAAGTIAAVWVILKTVQKPLPIVCVCLFLPMMASKAFFDFTTSGLENSLFYALYAAFGMVVLRFGGHARFWFMLSLVSALALFNRLDTVLFFAPALAWLVFTRFSQVRWRQVFLGASPLLCWFAFALFYYGFIFPNTKNAKLDTGLSPMLYLREGWHYLKYMVVMDIPSALILLGAIGVVWRVMRRQAVSQFPLCMAMGMVLYVLYIVNIGGDYMAGRFWAFAVFAAIWMIYVFMPVQVRPRWLVMLGVALALTSSPVMQQVRGFCKECIADKGRIDDAKHVFGGNKLFPQWFPPKLNTEAHHKFVGWGKKLAAIPPPHAEKAHYIGMLGYYSGASNVLVDEVALADPLLSRLPVSPLRPFYIGHFYRTIPKGYVHAAQTGDTRKMDPSLAAYYTKLRLITSGPLFSWERLKTIARFNLGEYDYWKYAYINCNVWT